MVDRSCTTCAYAWWDPGLWLTSLSTGFPSRPVCANHPDAPGLMKPVPFGDPCRNYRPKPPTPEGDVKRIPLGDGVCAYVDAADYEWLNKYRWHLCSGGYAGRCENGKRIFMHREIMQPPERMIVDHVDGNRANNCRLNLRVCTRPENQRNQRKRHGSLCKFKGVSCSRTSGKWFAIIRLDGKQLWLGTFDDEVEAARAYDFKAVELFGEFARLNFPDEWPPERRRQVYGNAQAAVNKEGKRDKANGKKKAKGRKAAGKTKPARGKTPELPRKSRKHATP